jgi:hypothetical protein
MLDCSSRARKGMCAGLLPQSPGIRIQVQPVLVQLLEIVPRSLALCDLRNLSVSTANRSARNRVPQEWDTPCRQLLLPLSTNNFSRAGRCSPAGLALAAAHDAGKLRKYTKWKMDVDLDPVLHVERLRAHRHPEWHRQWQVFVRPCNTHTMQSFVRNTVSDQKSQSTQRWGRRATRSNWVQGWRYPARRKRELARLGFSREGWLSPRRSSPPTTLGRLSRSGSWIRTDTSHPNDTKPRPSQHLHIQCGPQTLILRNAPNPHKRQATIDNRPKETASHLRWGSAWVQLHDNPVRQVMGSCSRFCASGANCFSAPTRKIQLAQHKCSEC